MFHVDNVLRMSSCVEARHQRRLFGLLNILVIGLLIVSSSCHLTENTRPSEHSSNRHDRQVNLLEDEMCLASYDVSEGSIIRTHDSQQLGAKYLNETDLGQRINSRDDCLRLCCRTAHCNVAVFEEKNSGSCYLFDCGPVEDLRCKFTSQPQYMSAILRKREIAFPSLNQHETELSQLRAVDGAENNKGTLMLNNNNNGNLIGSNSNEPNKNKQPDTDMEAVRATMSAQTTPTTVPAQLLHQQPLQQQPQPNLMDSSNSQVQPQFQQQPPPLLQQQPQPLTQRRSPCGRNQFECKSSGECIAIYNVCNGIPQCADGSDESSELHCPSDSVNQNPVVQKPKIVPASIALSPLGHSLSSEGSNGLGNGNFNHNGFDPNHQHNEHNESPSQQEEYRLPPPQQQSMSSNPMINNKNNGKGDPNLSPQPQMQIQPPSSPLNIFAHKDGGIMDEHENYGSQLQQQRHSSYWKPSSFDYNAGDSSSSNSNGNGYGMAVVPLANSGLYGNSVNNNNNYGSGPSSSYAYPQYPLPGIPAPSQSQQLQQQQQYGQYANGNNMNYNNLQPLQTGQQQQQLQQAQYYSSMNAAANPGYNNQNNNNLNNGLGNPNPNSPTYMINSPNRLLPPNRPPNQGNPNGGMLQSPVNQQGSLLLPNAGMPNQLTPSIQTLPRATNVSTGMSSSGGREKAVLVSAPVGSVNYNEISKLELPQSLRTLSSQIQNFASESEKDDLTDHSAGPGAVLAFVMGLGMSIIMVVVVGCRLRRIGTRRRGKNRLDPDYLVDGMYL